MARSGTTRTFGQRRDDPAAFLRRDSMAWLILALAGLAEVGWAVGLKYTAGFTRLWPTLGTVASMIVSLWLLGVALQTLPPGRSEGRRVGKACVSTCRSRGWP